MVSNQRYYERRAAEELRAATRAVTVEARDRRHALADLFARKAAECRNEAPEAGLVAVAGGGFEALAC